VARERLARHLERPGWAISTISPRIPNSYPRILLFWISLDDERNTLSSLQPAKKANRMSRIKRKKGKGGVEEEEEERTLLELHRTYSRSIIGIGTEPVPLVRRLLTTRYVRGIGARIDRGRLDRSADVRPRGEKDGRRRRVGWYGLLGLRCCPLLASRLLLLLLLLLLYRVMLKVALAQCRTSPLWLVFCRPLALFELLFIERTIRICRESLDWMDPNGWKLLEFFSSRL